MVAQADFGVVYCRAGRAGEETRMNSARIEVTLVPHGFEVDVWRSCEDRDESPSEKKISAYCGAYCFDFGDSYQKVGLLADRLAGLLVRTLRAEPDWLCSGAK
jgi:hypothetical protein